MLQHYMPTRIWEGQDAYIIGGGPSLRSFDWSMIGGRHTIGCNSAYLLGEEICEVCVFGDEPFYRGPKDAWGKTMRELRGFTGLVVTNCQALRRENESWLKLMGRVPRGLAGHGEGALGWNGNTGAIAVNLALLHGARRVFLLGFDMQLEGDRANWHDRGTEPKAAVYNKFLTNFGYVARDLPVKFPGCHIINVNDNSRLNVFPVVQVADHFGAM